MSQSKSAYGVRTPKDSARTRSERQNTNPDGESTETQVEPACPSRAVGHSVDKRDWREVAYDERRLVSYRACEWPACYPDGPPDASETETVVRSSHRPTVYHRPQTTATDAQPSESVHDERACVVEEVGVITDLREGDRVLWDGQSTPMRVVESTTDPSGVASLIGPDDGEYRIEARPEYAQPYYIRPGYAYQSELRRIVPADDQPRPEAV